MNAGAIRKHNEQLCTQAAYEGAMSSFASSETHDQQLDIVSTGSLVDCLWRHGRGVIVPHAAIRSIKDKIASEDVAATLTLAVALTVAFISGAVTKMSDPEEAMVESGPVSMRFRFAFLLSALLVASTRATSTCNAGHAPAGSLTLARNDAAAAAAAAAADETAVNPKALSMISVLQVLKKGISAGSFTSYKSALPGSPSSLVALDEDPKTIAVVKAFKLQSAAELKVHCFVTLVCSIRIPWKHHVSFGDHGMLCASV